MVVVEIPVKFARVGAACCQDAGQHDQVGGAIWQGSGGQDGEAVQQEVRHSPLWPHCRLLLPAACPLAWREPQVWTWWTRVGRRGGGRIWMAGFGGSLGEGSRRCSGRTDQERS